MNLSNLKAINDLNAEKAQSDKRHQDTLKATANVSDSVLSAAISLIKYLEGHTSKTQVVNQLKSINTPDALKVIPYLEKLDKTLGGLKNTDLTEITSVMNSVLDEAKKIPKELPKEKEQKFVDYTKQFSSLIEVMKSVEKIAKAQEFVIEAPIVNLPETNVNVEAPDLKPLQQGFKDVVTAVKKIVIPEYKTDNEEVEKLIKTSNKLLKELIDKPVSRGGGGGGGRATPYQDSAGVPAFVTLTAGGKIPIEATIATGDIEIGAVEIKNSTDDTRATVGANGLYTEVRASTLPSGAATSALQQNDALTNTQLRATPVPVSGSITTTETQPSTPTLANVTMTGSSITLQASNTARRNLMVFNDSGAVVYVVLGSTASATSFTVKMVDQAYYELPTPVYTGIVTAFGASGSVRVTEVV